MSEKIIFRMNSQNQAEVLAVDPRQPESEDFQPVEHVLGVTPYGMLLVALGGCTGILLNSYAQNRGLPLDSMEMRLEYHRDFDDDCDKCEEIEHYGEHIYAELTLEGDDLSEADIKRLRRISHQCPVHKILEEGIVVQWNDGA
jgi:uncharacterized OsmC-like protein